MSGPVVTESERRSPSAPLSLSAAIVLVSVHLAEVREVFSFFLFTASPLASGEWHNELIHNKRERERKKVSRSRAKESMQRDFQEGCG